MILLNKLINNLIEDISGKNVVSLIELMWDKENISEFKLADKLEVTVNQVRNMLYKLHSHNLVGSIRKKDKRKGWYIYYWTFNLQKTLVLLISLKEQRIALLEKRLKQKQVGNYFSCPNKCITLGYNAAMDIEFRCPECGSMLEMLDMKKQLPMIKRKIKILGEELEAGKFYLEKEIERIEKKKARLEKRLKKKPKRRVKRKKKAKKRGKKRKVKRRPKKKVRKKPKKRKVRKKLKRKKFRKKKPKRKPKTRLKKISKIKWR